MNASTLKELALSLGSDLVGFADLTLLKERFPVTPPDLLDGHHRAVSIGIGLDRAIVDEIEDGPTEAYALHYKEVNDALDGIAAKLTASIKERGLKALAIPASDVVSREEWRGAISHRAVGRLAGLGWSGKSLMLINPTYGPAFRMATVLTDMELEPDSPLENRCGSCTLCTDACVAGAILDTGTETFYENRLDAVNLGQCIERLTQFKPALRSGPMFVEFVSEFVRTDKLGREKGGGRREKKVKSLNTEGHRSTTPRSNHRGPQR